MVNVRIMRTCALLMMAALLVPAAAPVFAFTWAEPVDVPMWIAGDEWTYWTVSREEVTSSQTSPGLFSLTLIQTYISDNSTYTVGSGTTKVEGYDSYRVNVAGSAEFSGTYNYIDLLGLGLDESGCFSGTATNNGQMYRRISDLAFVKATLTISESATFYVDCGGTASTLLGTQNVNGNSEAIASPPINDLKFPMSTGLEWDTTSTVTTTITPQGGSPQQSTTVYDFHNKVNGTVDHIVHAGTFGSFEIHESGTKTKDSVVTDLDQSAYFAPDVKNLIDKTQEGEQLKAYDVNFYADLNITEYNISVDPETPSMGLPATVNVTIWNKGHEDATSFTAELWIGPNKIDSVDVASVISGGHRNVTFDWTPDASGSTTLTVIVDTTAAVDEYLETNNQAGKTVDVSEPRPDLRIEASDIDVPSEVPIESKVTIKATVHNAGNKKAEDVLVRFFDGSDQIGGDQTYDLIDQGTDVEASTVWTTSGLGGHTIRVELDPSGTITELSESNNEAAVAVNVVQLNYSFSMTVPITTKVVGPNETAEYQLNIKNTGKRSDTVNFVVSPPPTGWTAATDEPSLTLTSGSSEPVIVSVRSPLGAPAGTEVNLTVVATSQGDSSYKISTHLTTDVKQVAGADPVLKTSGEDLEGRPGETVQYEFTIDNKGNAPDTFALSVSTQKQWTTTIVGSSSTGEMASGTKKTVKVQTAIPDTALAGESDAVTLTVKSEFDTSYEQETTVVITSLQVFDLDVSVTPLTVDVSPGDTASYTAKITNDGNGEEDINLSIKATPELPEDWEVLLDRSVNVKSGKEKDVTFSIKVPDDAVMAEYSLTFEAIGGAGEPQTSGFTLNLLQVFDVEIEVLPPTAEVKAGKEYIYTITVKNNGNGEDTIELTIPNLDPKLVATFTETSVTLDAGDSQDVTLTIKAKISAKGGYTFEVVAASEEGDGSDTSNVGLTVKAVEEATNMGTYLMIGAIVIGAAVVAVIIWYKRTH